MTFITRFAPSPTGPLHLGHALSALLCGEAARMAGGRLLLRIEDIDTTRCRPEYEAMIFDDLAWLGLAWEEPVWRQSERMPHYRAALAALERRGLVYPCFCTRADVRELATAEGLEGPIYPGTCRALPREAARARIAAGEPAAWRLDLAAALGAAGPVTWTDARAGAQTWDGRGWGDVVLARKDIGTSYHLAVTVDDAAQGITDVIRGLDLFHATHVHVLLQRLLGLATPHYAHHELLTGEDGVKLSKRHGAESLRSLIDSGLDRAGLARLLVARGAPARILHMDTPFPSQ
ncbi:tRNA glutamyl-Q(34) synthetase GluQRS [Minwuia thermotolerans]|uniref:tRNA glutamyl-Q(34) synthetase GluQRS n=1 Tax=Minwuia thermotolerans TaxID=2056226 RepID=A0A2M9G618_9PROT|nr:tRNA glutamyl-Q(34) synthetase GluQRS [Minwuia thermotolerans]PJK31158.1 tRNA glutamyl-Q(34) synthetase GluQRS [Minwuia thermotolerans]